MSKKATVKPQKESKKESTVEIEQQALEAFLKLSEDEKNRVLENIKQLLNK